MKLRVVNASRSLGRENSSCPTSCRLSRLWRSPGALITHQAAYGQGKRARPCHPCRAILPREYELYSKSHILIIVSCYNYMCNMSYDETIAHPSIKAPDQELHVACSLVPSITQLDISNIRFIHPFPFFSFTLPLGFSHYSPATISIMRHVICSRSSTGRRKTFDVHLAGDLLVMMGRDLRDNLSVAGKKFTSYIDTAH